MTRDSLRHLENTVVLFSGRKAEVRTVGDQQHVCLRAVRCWRWDQQQGIDDLTATAPVARVDHAWVTTSHPSLTEMGVRVVGAARVGWYARRDGTTDLGLAMLQPFAIWDALEHLRGNARGRSTAEVAAVMEDLLTLAEQKAREGSVLIVRHGTVDTFMRDAWRLLGTLQRSAEAEARARAGHLAAVVGRRTSRVELFPVPSTRRRRPVGIRPMEVCR